MRSFSKYIKVSENYNQEDKLKEYKGSIKDMISSCNNLLEKDNDNAMNQILENVEELVVLSDALFRICDFTNSKYIQSLSIIVKSISERILNDLNAMKLHSEQMDMIESLKRFILVSNKNLSNI